MLGVGAVSRHECAQWHTDTRRMAHGAAYRTSRNPPSPSCPSSPSSTDIHAPSSIDIHPELVTAGELGLGRDDSWAREGAWWWCVCAAALRSE
eukprot:1617074-Rhodomonas_salina.1